MRWTGGIALVLTLVSSGAPAAANANCEKWTREAREALRKVEAAARAGDVTEAGRAVKRLHYRLQSAATLCKDTLGAHRVLAKIQDDGIAAYKRAGSVSAANSAKALVRDTPYDVGREAGDRLGLPEWSPPATQSPALD